MRTDYQGSLQLPVIMVLVSLQDQPSVITMISGYMYPDEERTLEEMLVDAMSFVSRFMCIVFEAEKRGNDHTSTVDQLNKLFDL